MGGQQTGSCQGWGERAQPVEPHSCPSDPCEARAPRGSLLINPPELSSPRPAKGTRGPCRRRAERAPISRRMASRLVGRSGLMPGAVRQSLDSGGKLLLEGRSKHYARLLGGPGLSLRKKARHRIYPRGYPLQLGGSPGTPRNHADCALLTLAPGFTNWSSADLASVRCICARLAFRNHSRPPT